MNNEALNLLPGCLSLEIYKKNLRANIPTEMREARRWCGYTVTWIEKENKWEKKPVNLRTRSPFGKEWNKPENLLTLEEAMPCIGRGVTYALGFVLGDGWFGLDLDDHDGAGIPPELLNAEKGLDGVYRERSMSGKGLHSIGRYSGPKLNRTEPLEGKPYAGKIELYTSGRAFLISADDAGGLYTAPSALLDMTSGARGIYDRFIEPKPAKPSVGPQNAPQSKGTREPKEYTREDKRAFLEQNIADIMRHIDPDCSYGEWIRVGMALKTEGYTWEDFDSWSATGTKYRGEDDTRAKWDSFDIREDGPNGGTLVNMARAGGWNPPRTYSAETLANLFPPMTDEETHPIGAEEGNPIPTEKGLPVVIKPDTFTDTGNIDTFTELARGWICYSPGLCEKKGSLAWNGHVWVQDNINSRAYELARRYAKRMHAEAKEAYFNSATTDDNGNTSYSKEAERYLKWAEKSLNEQRIKAIVEGALRNLTVPPEKFDADPDAFNTPAGLVNLNTGEIRPARPEDYCTMITTCAPDFQGLAGSMWEKCLSRLFCGDRELIEYVQYVTGSGIIGTVYDPYLFIVWGKAGTGKSTLYNPILDVLGSYGGSTTPKVITSECRNPEVELAFLRGKRYILCGELEKGRVLRTDELKHLTSSDKIHACAKFFNPIDFKPTHHTTMYTNWKPQVRLTTDDVWRRLVVIPVTATPPAEGEKIVGLEHILTEKEGPIILAWAINGAVKFNRNKHELPKCSAVSEASAQYREEENQIANFIAECTENNAGATLRSSSMYKAFAEWTRAGGERYPMRERDFVPAVREILGEQREVYDPHGRRRYWKDILLTDEAKAMYGVYEG